MADKQIPDMTLPEINISYEPKYDGTTGEPIFNKDGKQLYFIKITGFADFKFTELASDEFKILKSHYKKLADEKGTALTYQDLKLLKLHIELWAREAINNGSIIRYIKKEEKKTSEVKSKKSKSDSGDTGTRRVNKGKKTTRSPQTNVRRNKRKDQEGEKGP
jgi:hypothetical protein